MTTRSPEGSPQPRGWHWFTLERCILGFVLFTVLIAGAIGYFWVPLQVNIVCAIPQFDGFALSVLCRVEKRTTIEATTVCFDIAIACQGLPYPLHHETCTAFPRHAHTPQDVMVSPANLFLCQPRDAPTIRHIRLRQ
jgi:hypothetical protein